MEPWRLSSVRKWDVGLWKRLEGSLAKRPKDGDEYEIYSRDTRREIFNEVLWHKCGFCGHAEMIMKPIYVRHRRAKTIPETRPFCGVCPLHPDYCSRNIVLAPFPRRMKRLWARNERGAFEKTRKRFVESMKKVIFYEDQGPD